MGTPSVDLQKHFITINQNKKIMGTYLKPETTSLSRLNNKEYLNMMQRIAALLSVEETVTKLGVGSILLPFNALSLQLEDLVNRTMANAEK